MYLTCSSDDSGTNLHSLVMLKEKCWKRHVLWICQLQLATATARDFRISCVSFCVRELWEHPEEMFAPRARTWRENCAKETKRWNKWNKNTECSTYLVQHSSPIVLEPHLDLSVSLTLALTITKRNNNLMLNFEGTPVLPDTSQSMPGRVSVTRWGRSFTSSPLAFAAPASSIVEYDRINDRIV